MFKFKFLLMVMLTDALISTLYPASIWNNQEILYEENVILESGVKQSWDFDAGKKEKNQFFLEISAFVKTDTAAGARHCISITVNNMVIELALLQSDIKTMSLPNHPKYSQNKTPMLLGGKLILRMVPEAGFDIPDDSGYFSPELSALGDTYVFDITGHVNDMGNNVTIEFADKTLKEASMPKLTVRKVKVDEKTAQKKIFSEKIVKLSEATKVMKIKEPIVIDGKLNEALWGILPKYELKEHKQSKELVNKTFFNICYDSDNLYFAFRCMEKEMGKIKNTWNIANERDGNLWEDDCVEIFIDPYAGSSFYYHFIVNVAGLVYDAKGMNRSWNSEVHAATSREKDFWIAEITIPFISFGYSPKGNEIWRANLCRSQKHQGELSSYKPTFGGFHNPERFAEFLFDYQKETLFFRIAGLQDKKEDKLHILLRNDSKNKIEIVSSIKIFSGNKVTDSHEEETVLARSEGVSIMLPYRLDSGVESMDIAIKEHGKNINYYQNKILIRSDLRIEENRFNPVQEPLYTELFSDMPIGLAAKDKKMLYWAPSLNIAPMRSFALQYGIRYSFEEEHERLANENLVVFDNIINFKYKLEQQKKSIENLKKNGVKTCLFLEARGAGGKPISPSPFTPDPVAFNYMAQQVHEISSYADLLWGISCGDEHIEKNEKIGLEHFKTKKDNYILTANDEIKQKFGFGEFGIPLSEEDVNPFRWIAYRKWLVNKLLDLQKTVYTNIKKHYPQLHVVSYDGMGTHIAQDLSRYKESCDILTHQLYPLPHRINFGFTTKLLKDISQVEEFWPCLHVEHYAGSFSPEEVLTLISDSFRSGATGFHIFPIDTIGVRSGFKHLIEESIGAPERWKLIQNLFNEITVMKKLKYPKADFAVFYSSDSYMAQRDINKTDEIEAAYSFLGPLSGGWFSFINDYQIERGMDLSAFKAIVIPYAKYQRETVIKKFKQYVENGGILVCGDPEVFSFDTAGKDMTSYRNDIFGVKALTRSDSKIIQQENNRLTLVRTGYAPDITDGIKVLARYVDDGTKAQGNPAIIEKKINSGRSIFFGSNPFSTIAISDAVWKNYFKTMLREFGLKTDNDIWRFQFPKRLIEKIPLPDGKCLTGNAIAWRMNEAVTSFNLELPGSYTYSVYPDQTPDNVQGSLGFKNGKLTDRWKAPKAGNVDCGKGKLTDWIVAYKKPDAFSVIFDFSKKYDIDRIQIWYQGQLPEMTVETSSDGKTWKLSALKTIKEKQTEDTDVLDKILKTSYGEAQFVKMNFGSRDKDRILTLAEIEVWAK